MLDVIGIGAINVDYIATRERLLHLDADAREDLRKQFEHGDERAVSESELESALRTIGAEQFETCLGGSSLNVIQAIAALNCGFRLGYVGVCGNDLEHNVDFAHWSDANQIDTQWVRYAREGRPGRCVSFISQGERSLLTNPGVNVQMASHLEDNFEPILSYITQAKLVHVTSFLDDKTPKILFRLLAEAKNRNPWLRISYDPGHTWVVRHDKDIQELYRLSDYLFLNDREFKTLGHWFPGMQDNTVAQNIMRRCDRKTSLLVLKRYDSIGMFYHFHDQLVSWGYDNVVLEPDSIEDATGAGDVFAAGFLAGIQIPGFAFGDAIQVALKLVKAKLLSAGTRSFYKFPSIFAEFVDESARRAGAHRSVPKVSQSPLVFLSHGRSQLWTKVNDFLEERLGTKVLCWEAESRASHSTIAVLQAFLNQAHFVVAILTAEDTTDEGTTLARQNVVHEVGLFQGRLGFDKVVLLTQNTTEMLTNLNGLQEIRFDGEHIEGVFKELEKTLRRERILL
jgi:sugar/nucleoside kinase (ribokinase family)